MQGDVNPLLGADVTSEGQGFECTGKGKALLFATVCNRGAAPLAAETPVYFVSFPEPDFDWPVCIAQTETVLMPGHCQQVTCQWDSAPTDEAQEVVVRGDDNGTGVGETTECDESNNQGDIGMVVCE